MTAPEKPRRSSSFGRYFVRSGWIHALLLLSVWMFLFPFLWMLATSVKTDEELAESSIIPAPVIFRPDSPYVRKAIEPARPIDASPERWKEILPQLMDIAS